MFTPPASPQPVKGALSSAQSMPPLPSPLADQKAFARSPSPLADSPIPSKGEEKRRIGRRFRYAVIFVPFFLVALTLSARVLTADHWSRDSSTLSTTSRIWGKVFSLEGPQEVHVFRRQSGGGSSASGAPTGPTPAPTVPESPPVLPTPFPQPFDGVWQQPTTPSCRNFFSRMANSQPFRACRPFSLLWGSSDTFLDAQTNLPLLNNLVWGTCNTNIALSDCIVNMDGYAADLRRECATELSSGDYTIEGALIALDAYAVMREAACLSDPTTNTYCLVNAARDGSSKNLDFYSLFSGIKLTKNTDPQCTPCLRSLMSVYSTALKTTPNAKEKLSGLFETYETAAERALAKCGLGFALTNIASPARSDRLGGVLWTRLGVMVLSMMVGSMLL
ncbi:hypothetical protein FA15DRAFT_364542 [Coprinopsis marcescibilis]|uniref:DUF7729 domain-containing protein n=1 Tax=Coprinopsis marcescibilis TaxID=230819 RepID=A0A5C3LAK6_COPMA|nr:hypothetical protein FA15DRAFT_364542 [Coprinopsis marcescibilis]